MHYVGCFIGNSVDDALNTMAFFPSPHSTEFKVKDFIYASDTDEEIINKLSWCITEYQDNCGFVTLKGVVVLLIPRSTGENRTNKGGIIFDKRIVKFRFTPVAVTNAKA